ncbi:hypothetical protein H8959_000395 [Pygathrix nigripes]
MCGHCHLHGPGQLDTKFPTTPSGMMRLPGHPRWNQPHSALWKTECPTLPQSRLQQLTPARLGCCSTCSGLPPELSDRRQAKGILMFTESLPETQVDTQIRDHEVKQMEKLPGKFHWEQTLDYSD